MTEKIRKDILTGWTVLVVDDEPDSLDVARRILKYYGANVATAVNGRDALNRVRAVNPRFIISDLSMPEMDGWALLYELKQDRSLMDIPVIALTAHAMAGDRERGIKAGFHNYMTKPLTPATFMHDLLILLLDVPEFVASLTPDAPAEASAAPPPTSLPETPSSSKLSEDTLAAPPVEVPAVSAMTDEMVAAPPPGLAEASSAFTQANQETVATPVSELPTAPAPAAQVNDDTRPSETAEMPPTPNYRSI